MREDLNVNKKVLASDEKKFRRKWKKKVEIQLEEKDIEAREGEFLKISS